MLHRISALLLAIVCMIAAAAVPAADATPRYNSVELQAEAQREVQNDLLNAVLYVELNDSNP